MILSQASDLTILRNPATDRLFRQSQTKSLRYGRVGSTDGQTSQKVPSGLQIQRRELECGQETGQDVDHVVVASGASSLVSWTVSLQLEMQFPVHLAVHPIFEAGNDHAVLLLD